MGRVSYTANWLVTAAALAWAGCGEPAAEEEPAPVVAPVEESSPPVVERPDPAPVAPVVAGSQLFHGPEVLTVVELTVAEADIDALRLEPKEWVDGQATITTEEEVFSGALQLRLKGNGSFQPIDEKPSFKLDTGKADSDPFIDGLEHLVMNNCSTDPSCLREHETYWVYNIAGVPAPRTGFAKVLLNGEVVGLYVLVEDVDDAFLAGHYDDPTGPLYEMFDVDLTTEGVEGLDHDGGPDDRSELHALADALDNPDVRFDEDLPMLDVDLFIKYLAASAVIGQFDAYPYSFPGDDVYLYADPQGQIQMLPHGGDETFTDAFRPVDWVYGSLGVHCVTDAYCSAMFEAQVASLLTVLNDQGWTDKIAADIETIAPQYAFDDLYEDAVRTQSTDLMLGFAHTRTEDIELMSELRISD